MHLLRRSLEDLAASRRKESIAGKDITALRLTHAGGQIPGKSPEGMSWNPHRQQRPTCELDAGGHKAIHGRVDKESLPRDSSAIGSMTSNPRSRGTGATGSEKRFDTADVIVVMVSRKNSSKRVAALR